MKNIDKICITAARLSPDERINPATDGKTATIAGWAR
jgi:hypothetical protein